MSLIFLRHSQRHKNDLTIEKSLNRVGKYNSDACLKSKLKDLNISEIYCSPFLRCLQTINEFSKEYDIPIKIEACLAEKYSEHDLTKIKGKLPDNSDYCAIVKDFKIDTNYLPIYGLNNLFDKEYSILNETFNERIELFTDFLNNCKHNDKNILVISHLTILNSLIQNLFNEDTSLKMGEFIIKKLQVKKKQKKMILRQSFLI